MTSHQKHLLTYFALCLAPLLLVTIINYWYLTSTIDSTVGGVAQDNLNTLTGEVDRRLEEAENELVQLSVSKALLQSVNQLERSSNGVAHGTGEQPTAPATSTGSVPVDLQLALGAVLNGPHHWSRLTLYGNNQRPLLQADRQTVAGESREPLFRRGQFAPSKFDRSVLLNKRNSQVLDGSEVQFTLPVLNESAQAVSALLAGEADLVGIISEVAGVLETADTATGQRSIVVVVDRGGNILYHSDHVFQGQPLASAMPEFAQIAQSATDKRSGIGTFRTPTGQPFLTVFSPLPRLGLAMAVGRDRSQLTLGALRWGLVNLAISLIIAMLAALLLERYAHRASKSIARMTEDLSRIAQGEFDRRIELRSGDDARPIADNINTVTERLRAQIAREAESRQFDSFVRLSAMLTHDLKNAIEALSLTVGNMERHFDNEQFRTDAMKSVAGATEKLKAVVARLTRPLTSLSGEYKSPAKVDLVPSLKRAVAATAGPLREKHTITMKLPPTLFALVNAERIEAVIENLVLNAIEAMNDEPGTLTIEAGELSDGSAMFSVTDTGPGISQTFIEQRLFRPFATTKRSGVGLGLYTCRESVQADGGTIEVDSTPGVGTTFRVVLPSTAIDRRD